MPLSLSPPSEGAMRQSRFTEEQTVAIIREADRARYRRWPSGRRERADDLCMAQALRQLSGERSAASATARSGERAAEEAGCRTRSGDRGDEGSRLKKLVSVPARRRQVTYGRERGLSARRACTLFLVARSALSYLSRKLDKDAPVIERMKLLSAQYPRYGYRRIRIFLGRDGHRMSVGRACRLWQAGGVEGPRKRGGKRGGAGPPRPPGPRGPNPGG